MDDVLLVTSAIKPTRGVPWLQMTDASDRLVQTYCALLSWITRSSITKIVLCDNTDVQLSFAAIKDVAAKHDKTLETLVFSGNRAKTEERGKGYGEGEIIQHALAESQTLRTASSFFKITGRVFVSNFDEVERSARRSRAAFDLPMPLGPRLKRRALGLLPKTPQRFMHAWKGEIPTIFYKCTSAYYKRHLTDAFQSVDDCNGYYLEHAFYSRVVRYGFTPFKIRPNLVGKRGTNGALYAGVDYPVEIKTLAEGFASNEPVE